MTVSVALLALTLSAAQVPQTTASDSRISQVPNGTIAHNTYLNDAFEVSFRVSNGWTLLLEQPHSAIFAPDLSQDDPVNKCSRALFSSMPSPAPSSDFGPRVVYFAIDPECFPGAPFPKSAQDRVAVTKFARRITNAFAHTPYIAPDGADFGGFDAGRRAFITITTGKKVSVERGMPSRKEIIHVNTLLTFIESNGYWIVAAEQVDDEAKKIVQAGHIDVSERH